MLKLSIGDLIKILMRRCLVCGKKLKIKLKEDENYTGGNYFGRLDIPDTKNWRMKIIKQVKISNMKMNVVNDPPVKKRIEYWECDKCYKQ